MKSKAVYNYIKEKPTQEECSAFIDGYEKCEEDMVDKKYTEEDMIDVFNFLSFNNKSFSEFKEFINSLNKQD